MLKPSEQKPTGQTQFPFSVDMIRKLCEQTIEILQKRPIVLKLRAPIKIFGDIHGQYYDLMRFFDMYGTPSENLTDGDIDSNDYLFLGD